MFNIRDWTLEEQHNVTVIMISTMVGFLSGRFVLDAFGILDLNTRLAITGCWALFVIMIGIREYHFPTDPYHPKESYTDLFAVLFALATAAALTIAAFDHVGTVGLALPYAAVVALAFYLHKTKKTPVTQKPNVTKEDLIECTQLLIKIAQPTSRPIVKETFEAALKAVADMPFDMTRVEKAATPKKRTEEMEKISLRLRNEALRTALMKTMKTTKLSYRDEHTMIDTARLFNEAAHKDGTVSDEDFRSWEAELKKMEAEAEEIR